MSLYEYTNDYFMILWNYRNRYAISPGLDGLYAVPLI